MHGAFEISKDVGYTLAAGHLTRAPLRLPARSQCRLVTADDLGAGYTTMFVPPASAQPLGDNASRVFSQPDYAVVVHNSSRVPMMDISVAAVPQVIHQHGEWWDQSPEGMAAITSTQSGCRCVISHIKCEADC